eukprot:PITA_30711
MGLYRQNRQEEEELRQKSRCLWLKARDKNTSFFHNNLNLRRAGSQIDTIQAEGKEIKEREEIKEAAHTYFKTLLISEELPPDSIEFLQQVNSKISDQQNSELEKEVTEEEIRKATWSMHPDKAPRPDGFTIAFYKTHWDIIKKDYEAIHRSIQINEKGMVIKLDMANAFDRFNHQYLVTVLQKFRISIKFLNTIMECISNPWTAPLINGRPSRYFHNTRGLRKGCPLSPFLYIIMAETLSIQLEIQRNKREITGISIARGIKEINHSLFANDTLLIGGASSITVRRFKKILDVFLAV